MFRGATTLSLDPKGRMAIPARAREELQHAYDSLRLVVTVDKDRCLVLYPESRWEEIERAFSELPSMDSTVRSLRRLYVGHAQDLEMDAQGRVLLPSGLRQFAKIDKKVKFVGLGDKFELWDEDTWDRQCDVWVDAAALEGLELPPALQSLTF